MTTFIPLFCYSPATVRYFNSIVACLFSTAPLAQAAENDITLEIALDRDYHISGSKQGIYTLARINAPATLSSDSPQLPLNLCLVIDRSGSMAGSSIEQTKIAITQAIETLNQNDVISLVTYGSDVETLISAQPVKALNNLAPRIQSIEAIGGSALYDAINQAAAQLRRHRTPNSVNRMIILSDGEPTKGPREIEDFESLAKLFASENISISTIGLGNSFKEDLLSTLSTLSSGTFYYVKNPEELTDTLIADITPLNTIVARDIVLTLDFDRNVEIEEALGKQADIEQRTAIFKWNQLYSGTELKALLSATFFPTVHSHLTSKIVTATLSYLPASNAFSERVSETILIKTKLTSSKNHSLKTRIPDTLQVAYSLEIADSIREAIQFADEGKLDKGLKEIRTTLSELKWINYSLEDDTVAAQIETLQKTYDRIKAEGMNQIDRKTLTEQITNQNFTSQQVESPTEDSAGSNNR